MTIRRPLLIALAAAGLACTEVHDAYLSLGVGDGMPFGFQCTDESTSLPLYHRAVEDGVFDSSVVVDFLALGGVVSCHAGVVAAWCAEHGCEALPAARQCIHVPAVAVEAPGDVGVDRAAAEAFDSLHGRLIMESAPEEPVIIRVVWTAQPCDGEGGVSQGLDPARVLGCVTSCPVQLADYSGDVLLELPAGPTCTLENVLHCVYPGAT